MVSRLALGLATQRPAPRLATPADAPAIGVLLDAFNTEFATPTPGPEVLAARLAVLLATPAVFAVVAGEPLAAVALVTLRPNVFTAGPVALLDELYVQPPLRNEGIGTELVALMEQTARERDVEIIEVNVDEGDIDAMRFYERSGYSLIDPDTKQRAFYLYRELTPAAGAS